MAQKKVIVKFRENLLNPQQPDAASDFITRLKNSSVPETNWQQLVQNPEFLGINIKSLNTSIVEQDVFVRLVKRANEIKPGFPDTAMDFLSYFTVYCPSTVKPSKLIEELNNWGAVEEAYIGEAPSEDPNVTKGLNTAFGQKDTGYLTPAPKGIDAEYAWTIAGGDGGGQDCGLHFFDIESNWDENHPDLHPSNPTWTNHGFRKPERINHGTKVLGIVIASDSEPLGPFAGSSLGITPHVNRTSFASYWINADDVNYFAAILFATSRLTFGDVLLLEIQVNEVDDDGSVIRGNLPVEYFKHNYRAIHLATWLGIAVVEAAGNNGYDLGSLGKSWLQRPSPNHKDSGAILVTAASPWVNGGSLTPPTPPDYIHVPVPPGGPGRSHNFGDRIDCYAWGDNIYTTQSTGGPYGNFGDTSGASAIIAGAALSIQGMRFKRRGNRFGALELRTILSDPQTGTFAGDPSSPPPSWNHYKIGVMPDLRKIHNLRI